ncbi:hypothetical protein B566_EDAN012904 [Ephemera danica]|nr:hypothetical protein B566_EDAN012904 [Ephemera danica]
MALRLMLCVLVLLHGWHIQATLEDDFQVFVASKRLTPLLVFAPPAITTVHTIREPKLASRSDVPLMLCGALILAPDLLVTSIRCCPRSDHFKRSPDQAG